VEEAVSTRGAEGPTGQASSEANAQTDFQTTRATGAYAAEGLPKTGCRDELCTLKRIGELIKKRFGVAYEVSGV
jgi:hypothetical protein